MKWARLFKLAAGQGRRSSRSTEDDPAGMGTAFGLDASVPDLGHSPADASKQKAAASARAAAVTRHDRIVRRSGL